MAKIQNLGLLSMAGLGTSACNTATDDQCYAGLGIIAGAFCASQNDIVTNTQVTLSNVSSSEVYDLTTGFDADGQIRSDTIEFSNSADVVGTKYTLTDGDILKDPGKVSLQLINAGSINGQKIFGAEEIEILTQGTTVVLATDWINTAKITTKNSDQSVTLNNLQSSQLDSAIAADNSYYPGTHYKIENVNAPDQTIGYFFNEDAILGTSTELSLSIKDSQVGLQAGVFVNPVTDDAETTTEVDPFAVAADTNIENLNLTIDDSAGSGSKMTDIVFSGLQTLRLLEGLKDNTFEVTNPLDATLIEVKADEVPADLKLNVSDSLSKKSIILGSGDDTLSVGDALVALPETDNINTGAGFDKLIINFADAKTVAPTLTSVEVLDLHFNGESTLDLSNTEGITALNFLESESGVSVTDIPFDISNFNVSEAQTGTWSISFEDNADSTPNLVWTNNGPTAVAITSLSFDEVKSLSLTTNGANHVALAALSLDPDDTALLSFTNTDDGNLTISEASQMSTFDALTSLSLTSTKGGNITLGSAANGFGIDDCPKLMSISLNASQTGSIELGDVGDTVMVEDLQTFSITSSGANISVGDVSASKAGTLTLSISSSGMVSFGALNLGNAGTSLIANGSGVLGNIVFSDEAYDNIDFTDLVTSTSVSFSNANESVTFLGGSGNDTIVFGLGADTITGNGGDDIFVFGNGAGGNTVSEADIITDFQSGVDKLKLGLAGDGTADTGNYVEGSSSVANFDEALSAANQALANLNSTSSATELYAFEYDSSVGYLFVDSDSDGVAEDLLILAGVENSTLSPNDIIA